MQKEQHYNQDQAKPIGVIADEALYDSDPAFLAILDEMVDDGVMKAGCRQDQNF